MNEEDVVDKLDRKCFTNTGSKRMENTASHQRGIGVALRAANKPSSELLESVQSSSLMAEYTHDEDGSKHDGTTANLEVRWNQKQGSKAICQVRVRHEARSLYWSDVKFFRVDANVY